MVRLTIRAFAALAATLLLSCGGGAEGARNADLECTGAGGSGWCWLQPVPPPLQLHDFAFVDAASGFAVAEAGQVLSTRDGGMSWTRGATGQDESLGFVLASPGALWAFGSTTQTVLTSTNGGASWKVVGQVPDMWIRRVIRVDDSRLVAIGSGKLRSFAATALSSDAGRTWRTAALAADTVGRSGTLWEHEFHGLRVSRDFGASAQLALPCAPPCYLGPANLADDAHLVVVTSSTEPRSLAIQGYQRHLSTDAGRTWGSMPIVPPALPPGHYFAPHSVLGDGSLLGLESEMRVSAGGGTSGVAVRYWRSADGGRWSPVESPPGFDAFANMYATLGENELVWFARPGGAVYADDPSLLWRATQVPGEAGEPREFRRSEHGQLLAGFGRYVATRWYFSGDGGASWRALPGGRSDADVSLGSLQFFDLDNGFALSSDGTLLRSRDGGRNFEAVPLPDPRPRFGGALTFTADGAGWLRAGGRLYRSLDRGEHWQGVAGPPVGDTVDTSRFTSRDSGRVSTLACRSEGNAGLCDTFHWSTSDGGRTWVPAAAEPQPEGNLYFRTPTDVWRVSATVRGAVLHSTDGGASWIAVVMPAGTIFADVTFGDALHGWIVGYDGVVMATSDGGSTWQRQPTGTSAALYSVFALDGRAAWIAGVNNVLLTTATGGRRD